VPWFRPACHSSIARLQYRWASKVFSTKGDSCRGWATSLAIIVLLFLSMSSQQQETKETPVSQPTPQSKAQP
jgi:hypothetical protein